MDFLMKPLEIGHELDEFITVQANTKNTNCNICIVIKL